MTLYHRVSYLPISLFLSEEKGNRQIRREIWVMRLTTRTPTVPTEWAPHHESARKCKSFSQFRKPHFKGQSFWPLVPAADWPPTNWHNLIYLSWEEEWCEKQIIENTDLYRGERDGGKEKQTEWHLWQDDTRINWFCWKKLRWEIWTSRAYLWVVTTTGKESPRPAWWSWMPVWDYLPWAVYCSKQEDRSDKKKAITVSTLHYFLLISSTEQ